MPLRRRVGTPVRRAGPSRVPPSASIRPRWRPPAREHPPDVSDAQRLPCRARLRPECHGTIQTTRETAVRGRARRFGGVHGGSLGGPLGAATTRSLTAGTKSRILAPAPMLHLARTRLLSRLPHRRCRRCRHAAMPPPWPQPPPRITHPPRSRRRFSSASLHPPVPRNPPARRLAVRKRAAKTHSEKPPMRAPRLRLDG